MMMEFENKVATFLTIAFVVMMGIKLVVMIDLPSAQPGALNKNITRELQKVTQ